MPKVTNAHDPFQFTATNALGLGDVVDMDEELYTVTGVEPTADPAWSVVSMVDAYGLAVDMEAATTDAVWDVKGNTRDGYDLFND